MIENFPLHWPNGFPRNKRPVRNVRFSITFARARDELLREVKLLAGQQCNPVLSTNLEVRKDGLPYANRLEPSDAGVALWFTYKGSQVCMPCDKWDRVKDNIRSLTLVIQGMRQQERHGGSIMLDRMFTGFAQLPGATDKPSWRQILGVENNCNLFVAESRYKFLAKKHHPDMGGSVEEMSKLNAAIQEARKELG